MITVETDFPIAYDSIDHLYPFGTKDDNHTCEAFNTKLFAKIPPTDACILDLGCAGGGFVESAIRDGALAVGLEGSDYSLKEKRAAWGTIPYNLFTADITKPFSIISEYDGAFTNVKFNIITAWEVLEHLKEEDLSGLFDNIHRHSTDNVLFLGSASQVGSLYKGHDYHQNPRARDWWIDIFSKEGFSFDYNALHYFGDDMVRQDEISGGHSYGLAFIREARISPSLPT